MKCFFLTRLVLIVVFFASCEKRVQYDGTVYTKTGEPVKNVEVKFWYDESDDAFVPEMTNDKGVFVFNERLRSGRKIKKLTVNSIHGETARMLDPDGETGIALALK